MPTIPYPDVPPYPGVPALVRAVDVPPEIQIGLGLTQALLLSALQSQTQWGIFDAQGNQLGASDSGNIIERIVTGSLLSTNAFEFVKETRISDFPVEQGSFAAYNKVERPANPVVTLALAGSELDRTSFLNAINAACTSTELYSVVTPEVTYINYSIERYNYVRRAERGTTLLMVEISLKEIRQVSASYSSVQTSITNPQNPNAIPQTNGGIVQPQTPDQSVLKQLANLLSGSGSN